MKTLIFGGLELAVTLEDSPLLIGRDLSRKQLFPHDWADILASNAEYTEIDADLSHELFHLLFEKEIDQQKALQFALALMDTKLSTEYKYKIAALLSQELNKQSYLQEFVVNRLVAAVLPASFEPEEARIIIGSVSTTHVQLYQDLEEKSKIYAQWISFFYRALLEADEEAVARLQTKLANDGITRKFIESLLNQDEDGYFSAKKVASIVLHDFHRQIDQGVFDKLEDWLKQTGSFSGLFNRRTQRRSQTLTLKTAIPRVFTPLLEAIAGLSDEQFVTPCKSLIGNSIGHHVRHIAELIDVLERNYDAGNVNYEIRNRLPFIALNKSLAQEYLIRIIVRDVKPDKKLILEVSSLDNLENINVESSYYRELSYNVEHAIHHMALIRVGIKELTGKIPFEESKLRVEDSSSLSAKPDILPDELKHKFRRFR